jgi:lipoic acid synthetase
MELEKPNWLRVKLSDSPEYRQVQRIIQEKKIHTVCQEARCPNMAECWGTHRTASFMILGDTCTRRCRFCNVKTGLPGPVDLQEPQRVAQAVKDLELAHVVITMVNRDDLDHGGSLQMAQTVEGIRKILPACTVELLSSDMMGRRDNIARMVEAKPAILSHNIETVQRLTPQVRSRSDYRRSLEFLKIVKEFDPAMKTKSSMMLGLGEEQDEIVQSMKDLRDQGVTILNIGQYLQPSPTHLPVQKYWTPKEFWELRSIALELDFEHVESAPLVRSSYHAAQQVEEMASKIVKKIS